MSRYVICPNCGHRMRRLRDDAGYWDGETYYCEYCSSDYDDYDDDEDDDGERLSLYDAAYIWASNGMDEDYTFGYDEDELRKVLGV